MGARAPWEDDRNEPIDSRVLAFARVWGAWLSEPNTTAREANERARDAGEVSVVGERAWRLARGRTEHPVPEFLTCPPGPDTEPRHLGASTEDSIQDVAPPSGAEETLDELFARRINAHQRKMARAAREAVSVVTMSDDRPIGLLFHGDPHLDDDGCDLEAVRRDIERTHLDGVYGVCLGDILNNWIGNLERLWKHQESTERDGWRLLRWYLHTGRFLTIQLGNHDLWHQMAAVIDAEIRNAGGRKPIVAKHEARIILEFPGADPVRVMTRHDFSGRSIYNPTHGPLRKSLFDPWADVYVQGHTHQTASQTYEGEDGKMRTVAVVRGYKRADSYGKALGLHEHLHGECALLTIDPNGPSGGRCTWWWNVDAGLTWLAAQRALREAA